MFSSVSLNHYGTMIAIGDKFFNNLSGGVKILKHNSGSWFNDLNQNAGGILTSFVGGQGRFGHQVRLARGYDQFAGGTDGTHLVVGEPGNNRATIYYRVNSPGIDWASSGFVSDTSSMGFGGSVAINRSGNFVAVGYGGDPPNPQTSGKVRLFSNPSGLEWSQVGQEIVGPQNSRLGNNISIKSEGPSGNVTANPGVLLLGTDYLDPSFEGFGRVVSCSGDCASWSQVGSDMRDVGSRYFAYFVSMNYQATSVVISGAGHSGYISKVFDLVGGDWSQVGQTFEGLCSKMCYLGNRVATRCSDGLRVYQRSSGGWRAIAFVQMPPNDEFYDIDLSGDGKVLAATGNTGIYVYKEKGHTLGFF